MRRALLAVIVLLLVPGTADAARVIEEIKFKASDGAVLHALVGGEGDLRPRPLIVEFSPYAPSCCGNDFGPEYNYVQVHARGTGLSTGSWGAVGPRDQQDVSEFLAWACGQPWSDGRIGLYGFSASAIAVYNSMHLPLDCVKGAALMAGTADLYRDLLYPGGIFNMVPGTVVGASVGGLFLANSPARVGEPLEGFESGTGLLALFADILTHQLQDDYWIGRTQRPGPNDFPVLADTGFYDPEARGPFESFRMLRDSGAHLMVLGAHDGFPAGTGGPFPHYQRWFDRYVRGVDNGIDRDPKVQLWLGNGSREALLAGKVTKVDGDDWPVPGTRWRRLFLDGQTTDGAGSINDGTLSAENPSAAAVQSYPAVSSLATATDPHTTSAAGTSTSFMPSLTQMEAAAPDALTYTSPPLEAPLDSSGPANLIMHLSATAPETDIHAVIADVWPDGKSYPVGVGRLRTAFPDVDRSRSLESDGEIVQPYGDYSAKKQAAPGETREYNVEFWPLGNRFETGHRIRLYLVGTSAFMLPSSAGVNSVSLGGATPSRLLLPELPARAVTVGALGGKQRRCASRRRFAIRLKESAGDPIVAARVTVAGRRVPVRHGRRWRAVVDLRGMGRRRVVVRVRGRTKAGRRVRDKRVYHPCRS